MDTSLLILNHPDRVHLFIYADTPDGRARCRDEMLRQADDPDEPLSQFEAALLISRLTPIDEGPVSAASPREPPDGQPPPPANPFPTWIGPPTFGVGPVSPLEPVQPVQPDPQSLAHPRSERRVRCLFYGLTLLLLAAVLALVWSCTP